MDLSASIAIVQGETGTIRMPLIEHLETYLGPLACGWKESADGDPLPFSVVTFEGRPCGAAPYSTLGLSKVALKSSVSSMKIRHELLFLAPADFGVQNIPGVLQTLASEALGRGNAYLRGEMVGPRGPIFDGLPFSALYITNPTCLPDEFASTVDYDGNAIVLAWVIPITETEAQFVRDHGWSRFEDELERHDPDLADFHRSAVA